MTNYAKGDKIRVKMAVDVGLSTNDPSSVYTDQIMYSTTQVRESVADVRWTHFLFLGSDKVNVPGGTERPESGKTAVAEFDATITGELRDRPINTTEVTELRNDGSFSYTHFVYLGSDCVTKLENADGTPLLPEELPEPDPETVYTEGDKIRVRIVGGQRGKSMSFRREGMPYLFDSTVTVTAGTALHYLYRYGSGITVTGSVVDADFTAIVGGADGPDGTTQVKDDLGYTHYVLLQSENVARVEPAVTPAEPEPKPVLAISDEVVTFSTDAALNFAANFATSGSTIGVVPDELLVQSYVNPIADEDRITASDLAIESSDVLNRIAELEGRPKTSGISAVVRRNPRPGQERVLGSFAAIADAVAFIDDNDYDRTRVGVEITGGGDRTADIDELDRLRRLNEAGLAMFGSSQWITSGVRLYEAEFFDSDWARAQASEELAIDQGDTSSWPLSLIDWDSAAEYRRDLDYLRVEFDGENYYGANE